MTSYERDPKDYETLKKAIDALGLSAYSQQYGTPIGESNCWIIQLGPPVKEENKAYNSGRALTTILDHAEQAEKQPSWCVHRLDIRLDKGSKTERYDKKFNEEMKRVWDLLSKDPIPFGEVIIERRGINHQFKSSGNCRFQPLVATKISRITPLQ